MVGNETHRTGVIRGETAVDVRATGKGRWARGEGDPDLGDTKPECPTLQHVELPGGLESTVATGPHLPDGLLPLEFSIDSNKPNSKIG